jgi:hypothetical protein
MKTNRGMAFVAASVLLVGVLTVWGPASPGQPPAPPQQRQAPAWEYQFVEPAQGYENDYEKAFDDMGKKGWEYCEIRQIMKVEDQRGQKFFRNATVVIFKRPVKPAPSGPE